MTDQVVIDSLYVVSAVLFVLSLKFMADVRSSRLGNFCGVGGMAVAIGATLLAYQSRDVGLLVGAVVIGAVVGSPIGLKVAMTAVPQRTAMSHAFGSLAVALVGAAEYLGGNATDSFSLS